MHKKTKKCTIFPIQPTFVEIRCSSIRYISSNNLLVLGFQDENIIRFLLFFFLLILWDSYFFTTKNAKQQKIAPRRFFFFTNIFVFLRKLLVQFQKFYFKLSLTFSFRKRDFKKPSHVHTVQILFSLTTIYINIYLYRVLVY